MATQYRKIEDIETVLFNPESPVVVERIRVQRDLIYDVNVLQISYRNVDPLNIYGLGVLISLKDENGKKLYNDIEFNYYGIEVASGRSFGPDQDIVVEPDVSHFEITVVRADLSEGKRYRGKALLTPAPEPVPLESLGEFEDGYINKVLKLKPKAKVAFAHENTDDYWRCVCGRIYPKVITQCTTCRLKNIDLVGVLPELREERRLRELEEARIQKEKEEAERKRLEEEERQRQIEEEKKRKEEEKKRLEEEERKRQEEEKRRQEEEALRQKKLKRQKQLKIGGISLAGVLAVVLAVTMLIPDKDDTGYMMGDTPASEYDYSAEVTTTPSDSDDKNDKNSAQAAGNATVVILGDKLDETETKTVWRLFGTTEDKVSSGAHEYYTISAGKQRAYTMSIYDEKYIEDSALSCIMIEPAEKGNGIRIKKYNITHCTKKEYKAALEKLGYTDCNVIVAAPEKSSGSTALAALYMLSNKGQSFEGELIGTARAYGNMNVRSGPGVSYPSYGTTTPGMKVEVIDIMENGWMKIVWEDSLTGYAYTCYTYKGENYYSFDHS